MFPLDIPQPTPTQPPGFGNIDTVLGWVCWAAILVCFVGFMVSAAKLAVAYRNNEMESAKGLVLALVGCVIIGSAAAIINQVT